MLKLIELTQPMWLDLVAGVRLKVRPFTTALMFGVRAEFKREIEAMGEAAKEMTPEQTGALFNHVVARHAVMDWEGVGDENDEPLAFTLEGLAALMDVFGVLKAFEAKYVRAWHWMRKKTSRRPGRMAPPPGWWKRILRRVRKHLRRVPLLTERASEPGRLGALGPVP
jgi:hypothetical protein